MFLPVPGFGRSFRGCRASIAFMAAGVQELHLVDKFPHSSPITRDIP